MALALALKYRPTQFSDLIGQESVSQTLSLALDHARISHAYLFSGLRGSGKTSSARIFSRALQCEKGPTSTPCGECDNCRSALENRHLDIIEMDGASSRKIDDIRDLIEQTKYRPSYGRYKIFIIDEVHMLTKEAFNALLKTLEEPPDYVKFILATTDPLKLPATILSRTQHFRFKKIPHKSVVAHLANILAKEDVSYEPQALEIIARSGVGSLRDTLTIADQAINFCNKHITTSKVTEMLGVVDPETLREFFQAIFTSDDEKLERLLTLLEEYECEMIIDEMTLFLKESLRARDKDFPIILVDRFLRILSESKYLLNLNSDGSFVLLLLSLKMKEALKVKDIDTMIAELEGSLLNTKAISTAPMASAIPASDPKIPETPLNEPIGEIKPNSENLFANLVAKIYDRSQMLGEIFERNIAFVSYEPPILSWQSKAIGEDREALVQNYAHIKNIVKEIYGADTKINPIQEAPSQTTPDPIPTQELAPQTPPIQSSQNPAQEIAKESTAEILEKPQENPEPVAVKSNPEIFIEENKDLIESIKVHLGAREMIVLEDKKRD